MAESKPPTFFSPTTGIYSSTHSSIPLPTHFSSTQTLILESSSNSPLPNPLRTVKSFASGLRSLGIRPKDPIFLLLPNSVFFPVLALAVLEVGAVVAPLNPASSVQEVRRHLELCCSRFCFVSKENVGKVRGLGVEIVVIVVPDELGFDELEFVEFHSILRSEMRDLVGGNSIRCEDAAVLLASSGTSGPSKCVELTRENLVAMVELFVRFEDGQYEGGGQGNVYLCAIPMFHVYGFSLFVIGMFAIGATVVVMKKFDAVEAGRAIERHGVTHLHVVPPMLRALVRMKRAGGFDLSSLKQVSCGAAPLSEGMIQDFITTFPSVDFIQGYGMTETTAVGTRGFNTKCMKKYNSVGLLAPNMQAKVVDWQNGSSLSPGYQGELWLRGPAIMKGYLNNEDATNKTINKDGWLMTGDIAYFDQDGYLYVVDRLKEIIKYNGYQIAPADLEAVLIAHPEIDDAGVTAAPDDEAGQIAVACVVKKPGSWLSAGDVIAYTADQMAPYKKARKVEFVDFIPRSPSGKILRRLLRNQNISKL